jgi:hypothetical protein
MEIEDKMFLSFQDIQKVGCISADFPMIKSVDAARRTAKSSLGIKDRIDSL